MDSPIRSFAVRACSLGGAVLLLLVTKALPQAAPAVAPLDEKSSVVTLAPFEVLSDKGTKGYATANAMGATRINTPIADTPQTIVSLNQEFLRDVNPTNFADVLRFVSGISKTEGEYIGDVSIRGVTTQAIGFRDGIADSLNINTNTGITLPDPIEVERLEVIKGPAGVLYGSHGFGGVINRVSKRPLEQRRAELAGEYTAYSNSEGYYRTTLDATGPVDGRNKLLYRVIAGYQDGTNHTHGMFKKQTLVGTLEYRPWSATAVWLRVRRARDRIFAAQDLWTDSQRNMPFGYLPRNAYVGNFYADDQVDFGATTALEFGATQAFEVLGTTWNARLLGRRNDITQQRRTYISSGSIFFRNGVPLRVGNADMTTNNATWVQAAAAGFDDIRENILRRDIRSGDSLSSSLNLDITGEFDLGATRHRVLVYGGLSDDNTFLFRSRRAWTAARPSVFTRTELPPDSVLSPVSQTLAGEWNRTRTKRQNFAVQDNISLLDNRLILVGAMRYDHGSTGVIDYFTNTVLPNEATSNWTPTYGVVGKPIAGVSVFYNHSETFQPQGGVNSAGQRLRPLIGDNDEFGVKFDLLQSRLVLTGSYFDMSQENTFLRVIAPDGSFDFVQVPKSITKGYEIDLAAQATENLTLLVAYQWIDAKTQSGLAVRGVPQGTTYKAMAKYGFSSGALKGLSFGVSYEHINDRRAGDANNTYFLPGYDLVGGLISYQWRDWRFQANVENATDEWYVAGSTAQQFMRSGPPRYVKLGARYRF